MVLKLYLNVFVTHVKIYNFNIVYSGLLLYVLSKVLKVPK